MSTVEAYRVNRLEIWTRKTESDHAGIHVATAVDDNACELVIATLNMAFRVMDHAEEAVAAMEKTSTRQ